MNASTIDSHARKRLFAGICLALIPTGAQFALIANVLGQFKAEFILTNAQVGMIAGAGIGAMTFSLLLLGPGLEKYGMRMGTIAAFLGHLLGLTVVLSALFMRGDPNAYWVLLIGVGLLGVGNGMIEVAGNPLTTALYPEDKTTKLNLFHAFFPLGILSGALIGFGLNNLQGSESLGFMYHWTFQVGIIYIPILIYGYLVLPQKFPKTEYGESGRPLGEMFKATFASPLMYVLMLMLGLAMCIELGSGRWIPEIFAQAGLGNYAILLMAWTSTIMILLRVFAGAFVHRLSPPGMLCFAGVVTGLALLLYSGAEGGFMAFLAATCFGVGVAFFFPTIVGLVSERLPHTGSLGIILTMGVGLGVAGFVGTPYIGQIADVQIAKHLDEDELRAETASVLRQAEQVFTERLAEIEGLTPEDILEQGIAYRPEDIERALPVIRAGIEDYEANDERIVGTAVPVALREIGGVPIDDSSVVRAGEILSPAEAFGGQRALLIITPTAGVIALIFGIMYVRDRARGGYKVVRLDSTVAHSGVPKRTDEVMDDLADKVSRPLGSPDQPGGGDQPGPSDRS